MKPRKIDVNDVLKQSTLTMELKIVGCWLLRLKIFLARICLTILGVLLRPMIIKKITKREYKYKIRGRDIIAI